MDMAVEHGDGAEALQIAQRLRTVVGAPAPFLIDRPQRDMREHHDRLRGRTALYVILQPFELLVPEIAETAALQVDDVDEPDEVHAVGVETVITGPLGAAAVAFAIELALLVVEHIVLAGDVMHVEPRLRDDLLGVVELRWL